MTESAAPRLTDRLVFWVVASVALFLLAVLVTAGFSLPGIALLVMLMLVPLAVAVLLSVRAAARLMSGRSPDLNVWGSVWLRGRAALAVPVVIALLFVWMREFGGPTNLNANIYKSSHHMSIRWSDTTVWGSDATKVMDGVSTGDSTWTGSASRFSVEGPGTDAFNGAVRTALLTAPLPRGATYASVTIKATGASSLVPLVKNTNVEFEGEVVVHVNSGEARRMRWVGKFGGELDASFHGFLAAKEVPVLIGGTLGESLRSKISEKHAEANQKLAG